MEGKNITIVGLIVLLLLSIILFSSKFNEMYDIYEKDVNYYKTKANEYELLTIQKDSNLIVQKQLVLDSKSEIAKLEAKIEGLKSIDSKVKVVTKVELRDVIVPYTDTIVKYVIPEDARFEASVNNKWYNINLTVRQDGVMVDNLSLPDSIKVIVGEEKLKGLKNIFKQPIPIVKVENTNPHIELVNVENMVVKENKKPLNKILIGLGLGILTGILILK